MTSRSFVSLALLVAVSFALVACGGDDNEAYLAASEGRDASVATTADAGNDAGTSVDASLPTFAIGGTVTGLAVGSTLALSDGAGDTLTVAADGTFLFRAVPTGTAYAISVVTQPSADPPEICTVAHGTGILASVAVSNVEITCAVPSFTVGGTIAGLAGSGLVLEDNLGDDLPVTAAGGADAGSVPFTFPTPVATGGAYSVTVKTQPSAPAQLCAVTSGAGTIASADVSGVTITCENRYTVSASVRGLGTGETLVLQNNGGDDLTLTADGTQTFATPVTSGSAYDVTVLTQPSTPPAWCTLSSASGTATGNVLLTGSCTLAYYVDVNTGADSNTGTPAAPWKTITHAIATVPAGGTILVEPGMYTAESGEVFPLEPRSNQGLLGLAGKGPQASAPMVSGMGGAYAITGGALQQQTQSFLVLFANGVTDASLRGFSLSMPDGGDVVGFDGATAAVIDSTLTVTTGAAVLVVNGAGATLTGNIVSGGGANMEISDSSTLVKARGNSFELAYGECVAFVAGTASILASNLDFGTAADPGNNTFVAASDAVGFSATAASVGALVAGNTWNANVQGADANGHYAAALVTGPVATVPGNNYALSGSATLQF